MTVETAPLVKYLKADLQRIVNSANEELKNIRCAGLIDSTRQAEEAQVINEARAFAVRRVESTVRHLHMMKSKSPTEHRSVNGVDETEKTTRFKIAPPQPDPELTTEIPVVQVPAPANPTVSRARHQQPEEPFESRVPFELPKPVDGTELGDPVADTAAHALPEPEPEEPEAQEPEVVEPERSAPKHAFDSDDTDVLEELSTLLQEIQPSAQSPVEPPPPAPTPPPVVAQPPIDDTEVTRQLPVAAPAEPAGPAESERERLERVLKFVARQEPGLRWAVGIREDGSTLLVTDLAYGWIPPGLNLPADIQLLEPARRTGTAAALLGRTTLVATYAPGDPLGWATDYEVTDISSQPRVLPVVDDLGWVLGEATHWRDGLPRMVNTLAKAGAAGTGIVDAEIDILRVYLDTSRYQLLAQYPDVDPGLLLNCLLLAATEGIATTNTVSANYHFAWFQALSSPPASSWKAGP
ncbi:MAG: hypothetical protein QOC58_1017 [Mycobacterium sp.]|nr:hypothetical protein [Mycobacterium sp.]